MKQKVSVRAILRTDGKHLLLKRSSGRESILGKYELPGGKLDYGEQPEDALRRHLSFDTQITPLSVNLHDVISYIDHDDRDMQYVFVLYVVDMPEKVAVILSQNYSHYEWWSSEELQEDVLTESSRLLLGISVQPVSPSLKQSDVIGADVAKNTLPSDHFIIYSDGGSRGNPGPSASGFVVMDAQENVVHQGGLYLGITTNNQAEYHGVRLGLEKALEMQAKTVDFRIDSLLVVNQLNGIYKIKNRELWPINERINELVGHFDKVTFSHVRREYNQLADGIVNKILNARNDP